MRRTIAGAGALGACLALGLLLPGCGEKDDPAKASTPAVSSGGASSVQIKDVEIRYCSS